MRLIYAYIRQSSLVQVRYGYNLDEQERQIRDYCEYNFKDDYDLQFYIDAGKSGTNMKRPQLQKMLKDSKKYKPDIVVFHNIDRLSRELIDLWSMIKFFIENNIQLASVIGYIDLTTAYGKGNVLNEGLSAMIESMKISDRTIRALKQGVYEGKYPFSGIPLGYKKINNRLYLTDDQNEIETIKFIFETIASNKFNMKYVKRYICKNFHIPMNYDRLFRIVKNRLYTGTMEYKDIIKENYCEPLISENTWQMAVKNLRRRKQNHLKAEYYFRNICFCDDCKTFMTNISGLSKSKRLYAYYKCPTCKKTVSQVKLLDRLQYHLDKVAKAYLESENGIIEINKRIKHLKSKRDSLIEEQSNDEIDVKVFYKLFKEIDNQLNELEEQKQNIINNSDQYYETLNYENKKMIRDNYIEKIEISFDTKPFRAKLIRKI